MKQVVKIKTIEFQSDFNKIKKKQDIHIYQPPLPGQDMTQGQFFKRSLTGLNSEFSFS